jgi:Leucine-rich repeat (LRR) protein
LAHLSDLISLSELDLRATRVTDLGVAYLKRMTNLRRLDLGSTQVSDAGLAHLKGMTKLAWLSVDGTRVTDAGLIDAKQELTSVKILQETTQGPGRLVLNKVEPDEPATPSEKSKSTRKKR